MNKSRITFHKAVVGALSGLAGVIAGGALVKLAAPTFAGSAPWLFPAMVVGILAALMVAALIALTCMGERRRAKHRDAA